MRIGNFKRLAILSVFVVSLGIVGCGNSTVSKDIADESKVNLTTVLKYKDSYVGDNSAITNIVNNLPANIYNEGIELQTSSKPYEITIQYKAFKDISIRLEDDSVITSSFPYVMKNNALIILFLVQNVDIVNFDMDDGTIITYERTDLVNDYKDYFGNNLEEITKDKSSLENFIKTNKK
ncbi:DUF4825 domain-containing protein [Clostridium septicum]|uniref:DUF4825 domain-containing protein n=1 Tax=Clostridium septicum TaxID=1504 RepID=UPI00272E2E28|nr:DUF4825 domain-containing protein [Clostridium septicum]WLF68928.1 DUF4825 domain-containing protein [Clostridium septicum]